MKSRRVHLNTMAGLFLLISTAPVLADNQDSGREFNYTDDWAVVSAPPPPGPYRAVNIDPRVPGMDAIPPLPMETMSSAAEELPAEVFSEAPAAGKPAVPAVQNAPEPAAVIQQQARPMAPASRVQPPRPGSYYPAVPRYPVQTRPAPQGSYPGYRNQPAYGYGSPYYPQGQQQQQVPPPPVYDSMMKHRPPYGQPPGS